MNINMNCIIGRNLFNIVKDNVAVMCHCVLWNSQVQKFEPIQYYIIIIIITSNDTFYYYLDYLEIFFIYFFFF